MTSQISFRLPVLKDGYLENETRYCETESVLTIYFQMIFVMIDIESRSTNFL